MILPLTKEVPKAGSEAYMMMIAIFRDDNVIVPEKRGNRLSNLRRNCDSCDHLSAD